MDIRGWARMNCCCVPATYLPLDHGISVAPSGLLPSVRIRPGGSLELGMPAFERALQMMSLMAARRAALPTDFCMSAHDVHLGRRPLHIGINAVHRELVRGVI